MKLPVQAQPAIRNTSGRANLAFKVGINPSQIMAAGLNCQICIQNHQKSGLAQQDAVRSCIQAGHCGPTTGM